jgi:hypothetical protein
MRGPPPEEENVADAKATWPKTFIINDRLKIRVGYKDSRAEIEFDTRVPLIGRYTLAIELGEMPFVEQVFKVQEEWVRLSKARAGCKASIDVPISPKVTAKVGFEDRRVEIAVKVVFVTYTIQLSEQDEPRVREAFAEAKLFASLPEKERVAKGVK